MKLLYFDASLIYILQIRENLLSLVRAMQTLDDNNDGFISIESLKSVLDSFVFSLTADQFKFLMNKYVYFCLNYI